MEALRTLGHDVLTSYEAGRAGQALPDEAVLAFAHAESRCVLTLNRRHFILLHELNPAHSGIMVCTFDADFIGLAKRIAATLQLEGRIAGRLIRVNRPALP